MKLIAKKPCSFGGKQFYIGDVIPVELVQEPKTQEKYGILTIVNDDAAPAAPAEPGDTTAAVPLVVPVKDGPVSLALAVEDIQTVVDVLTATTDDAEKRIEQIDSDDILFLLHAVDSRKTVKAAAKARAQALSEAQEGTESAGDQ